MNTYIINLPKDIERRAYVIEIMAQYPLLEYEFVDAIYGKELTENETYRVFDIHTAYKRYGRNLNPGEIGCTLSHFKCYHRLLQSNKPYVLLLEDDITVVHELSEIDNIAQSLPTDEPWVLFLSADYWFTKRRKFNNEINIAHIYDAVGTYAYIINRKGAELLLTKNPRPSNVADHWSLYRRQGLKLFAVYPYMIDANIESFASSIDQECFGEVRKNMPLNMLYHAYCLSAIKKLLLKTGHFVSKIRK